MPEARFTRFDGIPGEKLWGRRRGCGTIVAVKLEWSAPCNRMT
jgi:hypothetical protein